MLTLVARRTFWIALVLCAFVMFAAVDNVPDPPATASACSAKQTLGLYTDAHVQTAVILTARLAWYCRTVFSILPSGRSSEIPILTAPFVSLPHAADSSPPLVSA